MKTAKMTPKQKNDHYGKLNERMDVRYEQIAKLGFKQINMGEFNAFSRKHPAFPNRTQTVPAAVLLYADEIVWADKIADWTR
jgi:hypothetical protein